ncbi:acetolactate synthase [Alicyclobacillus curvatus]|nr:acetolactate synthase [Alicyclobacillus curvatus]
MTGGRAVVEVLQREGISKVFCVPGESYLGVLDAFYDYQDIELISSRHEGGAAFMAEGFAKASGEVGVCMATRGVGSANLSIGVHTAYQDSTPMVVLIGQVERDFEYREAFQEVDLLTFFKPITKWAVHIRDASRIPELLHRAFYVARCGRPGPVVVTLPHDMLGDQMNMPDTPSFGAGIPGPYKLSRVVPAKGDIEQAREMLLQARKPILLVGGGVVRSGASDALQAFVEKFPVPVATAFRRFDAFPNEHPRYAGWLGFGPHRALLDYIKEADVALVIGTRLSQVTTQDYTLFSPHTRLIHVDVSEDIFGKSYMPALPIVADANEFIHALMSAMEGCKPGAAGDDVAQLHEAYMEFSTARKSASDEYIDDEHVDDEHVDDEYVDMEGVMHDLLHTVPKDTIVTSDAGNFFGWVSKYYRFNSPGTYIGPTSGAMGYGLPAAIGAKLAHPNQTVISFSGDGGFMMTIQEFDTAVRYNVPIVSIVVNNAMFGTIRAHQEHHFPGRVVGTLLSNSDYASVASSFGGHGERVTCNRDFLPALKRALNSNKPALIEIMTDPNILSVSKRL